MMSRSMVALILFFLILSGCKDAQKTVDEKVNKTSQDDSFKRVLKEGNYEFEINYQSKEKVSNLKVDFDGERIRTVDYAGKIGDEVFLDINKDGDKEFYFTTKVGNEANIHAFHLVGGKCLKIIKEDYNITTQSQIYDYKFVRGQLVEMFRVKMPDDKIGKGQSEYNLVFSEKGWELLPQGLLPSELKDAGGQYASRDATGAGYYKVMMIKDLGNGAYNVDIKVKQTSDKKELCNFNGNGYFLNRNLFVPLSKVSPELKGTLKIALIGLQAAVFTVDSKNSQEMVSFCDGVGSIAGNFKKTNI